MKTSHRSLALSLLWLPAFATCLSAQTPDSSLAVSSGGVSLFRVNVDGGAKWGGTYDGDASGSGVPVEGAGTRMLWYPRKAAFRAGDVSGTQWDAANIGSYSVAFGKDVRALGDNSAAFGIRTTASQTSSFAAGEDNMASGVASVALGSRASTNARMGAFVFTDRSIPDTLRAGVNHSANWRVSGGFRIFTNSTLTTGVTIQSGTVVSNWGQSDAVISTSTGAYLGTDGNWHDVSDVNRKSKFLPVSGDELLAKLRTLPIQSWSYKSEDESVRHIGPTAQDFMKAFHLGRDDKTITGVDAQGIALIGVQTLDERTLAMQKDLAATKEQVAELSKQRDALLKRLEKLEAMIKEEKKQ